MGIIGRVRETLLIRRKPLPARPERLAQQPQADRTIASEYPMVPDGLCALCNAACCRDVIIPVRPNEVTKKFFEQCVIPPQVEEYLQKALPISLLEEEKLWRTIPSLPEYIQLIWGIEEPLQISQILRYYPHLEEHLNHIGPPYLKPGIYLLRSDSQLFVGINGPCPWLNGNLCTLHEKYQNPNQPTPYPRGTQRLIECIRVSPGDQTCRIAQSREEE